MASQRRQRFIIWDPRDGNGFPRRDHDGNITSDGLVGRIGRSNAFLSAYAGNLRTVCGRSTTLDELSENDTMPLEADFTLSGERGSYEIFRVSDSSVDEPK
jgi:hypothetical protein